MEFSQLHNFGACSSVMLKNLNVMSKDHFRKSFKKGFFGSYMVHTETLGRDLTPNHMSFVVASTTDDQTIAMGELTNLGFTKIEKNFNEKNGTSPTLWAARVDDLRQNLNTLPEYKDIEAEVLPPGGEEDDDDDWYEA